MTSYVGTSHDVYPYSSVVWVNATFPNGASYSGSGVMVGPNDVLTADHMVYSVDDGGAATSVTVYPAYDGGSQPYGAHSVVHYDYTRSDATGDGLYFEWESQNDYALLALNNNVGYYTGMMGFDTNPGSGFFNVTGYPGVYAQGGFFRMINDDGYASRDSLYDTWNFQDIEVHTGSSGGPLWYDHGGGPTVVGVVSTELWAANISERLDQILGWMASNDGYMTSLGLTGGNDLVTGHVLGETIASYQGNDTLLGAGGNDSLRGGQGDDLLYGNQGADSVFGDRDADRLRGGQGDDYIRGGQQDDILFGDKDSDVLMGDLGNDTVFGGQLNDRLYGGAGDDRLSGDLGDDILTGGDGADTFYARSGAGNDVVTDYDGAEGDRVGVAGGYGIAETDGGVLISLDGGGSLLLQGVYDTVNVYTTVW